MANLPQRAEMERAYKRSDSNYDGIFFVGVRTTGVFCRPSCGARKPLPKNVDFFATAREAVFAGYRPCKRCAPMASAGKAPTWVTPLLDAVDRDPSRRLLDRDIRALGIDPARARRFFQKSHGMTFQAYCRGRRLGQALEQIRRGAKRAVGHANGLNRIAIIIPCHRVVNKNGKLGGYGGGMWRKQALLELERGERKP